MPSASSDSHTVSLAGIDFSSSAELLLEQCEQLALISDMPGMVSRAYLTHEHAKCNDTVKTWIERDGLIASQDQAGNILATMPCENPDAPTLLLGSHLDTVPNAGKYDGILGVLIGLEALHLAKRNNQRFPFNIVLIGFGDEEGTRFSSTLLGSRAVAGKWDKSWFDLSDKNDCRLDSALVDFGCDPDLIETCSLASSALLGYLEVHIEQGPVLEDADLPLGVVTSIAGAKRVVVDIAGQAGHAGTVPMLLRQDALVTASEIILLVERTAHRYQVVATVGRIDCKPGAPNVIPGHCQFTIDIRSGSNQTRDFALQSIHEEVQALVEARRVEMKWKEIYSAGAVKCAGWCQRLFETVINDMKLESLSLMSGAGHDAMSFASITDVGMLFLRCKGGLSHHPDESVTLEDTALSVEALYRALLKLRDDESFSSITAR